MLARRDERTLLQVWRHCRLGAMNKKMQENPYSTLCVCVCVVIGWRHCFLGLFGRDADAQLERLVLENTALQGCGRALFRSRQDLGTASLGFAFRILFDRHSFLSPDFFLRPTQSLCLHLKWTQPLDQAVLVSEPRPCLKVVCDQRGHHWCATKTSGSLYVASSSCGVEQARRSRICLRRSLRWDFGDQNSVANRIVVLVAFWTVVRSLPCIGA